MPFYPPDQLPPMQRQAPAPSRKRKIVFVVVGALLGAVLSLLLVWRFGSALAWLAIPCAAWAGWALALLPWRSRGRSAHGGERVLW